MGLCNDFVPCRDVVPISEVQSTVVPGASELCRNCCCSKQPYIVDQYSVVYITGFELSVSHICAYVHVVIIFGRAGWNAQQINDATCLSVESPLVSGGGPLSDLSLCLLHEPDSGQPFLCGHQSSGE